MSESTANSQSTESLETMDLVKLTEAHPLHRDEVKDNVGNKGYIHPGHTLDSSDEVLVKFETDDPDESGDLLWVNLKWLTKLDDPTPVEDPDREQGTLTPGCYQLTASASYPRFAAVYEDDSVLVRSTVGTLFEDEVTVRYLESWLGHDHWQETKIDCADTPFDEHELPEMC